MAARKMPSLGGKPDKLMRDALALELHQEDVVEGKKVKRLRRVARALVSAAINGDIAAIKEVNDRMDGKVPQALAGADGEGPVKLIVEALWKKPE